MLEVAACLAAVAGACVAARAADPRDGILAITAPSQRVKVAFPMQGVIDEVLVKPGDAVDKTKLLAKQNDALELAELAVLVVEEKSDVIIRNARNELAQAEVDLKRVEQMYNSVPRAASDSDFDKAKLDVEKGKLSVEKSEQDRKQAQLKADKQRRLIELLQLRSTVEGIVEKVDIEPGEVADPSKPAISIVVNNPLRVEANLPVRQAQSLSVGQALKVRYPNEAAGKGRDAKIIYRAPVADAGSKTQLVWLELPNPDKKDSGLQVLVDVPENLAEVSK